MHGKMYAWIFVWIDIFIIAVAYHFGALNFLYQNDQSFISIFIIGLYMLANIFVFACGIISDIEKYEYVKNMSWYVAGLFSSLGMLGTVIGFVFILFGLFTNLDFQNIETTKQIIAQMTNGMGVAMLTTLVGLITNILFSLKLVVLDHAR